MYLYNLSFLTECSWMQKAFKNYYPYVVWTVYDMSTAGWNLKFPTSCLGIKEETIRAYGNKYTDNICMDRWKLKWLVFLDRRNSDAQC